MFEKWAWRKEWNILTSAARWSVPDGSCYWSMLNPAQWQQYIVASSAMNCKWFQAILEKHTLIYRG